MENRQQREQITLSKETIHNPEEPRHFMRVKAVPGRVRILFRDRLLAESVRALRVIEVGSDLYDPVFYVPRSDVLAPLSALDKRTFCPLKGHAVYFDLLNDTGVVEAEEIAWSYADTLDFADCIKDYVAFYAHHVVIEEHPA